MFDIFYDENGVTKQINESSCAILGDSHSVLKQIRSKSVDLIFADPPYGIGKDFGVTKDCFADVNEYLEWCKSWIDECMRILKVNGTMYFMSSTQYMPALDRYVDEKYYVVNRIVWVYDSSGVQSKSKFGSLYEPILMITHDKNVLYTFNYKDILVEAKTGAERKLIDYRKTPPQPYNTTKVPGNVWEFSRVRYKMDEYENHPSQKPEALLERIILASSNKGEIVLDPFSGSFTTSAVAVRLGRLAVGVDVNPDYYKIGIRRTNIALEYDGELLMCDKSRKTQNKSKRDHFEDSGQLALNWY
ncbi:MAG: adenine-specific DNA-methyltransferase [Lachnospiraceae bacterium]|nr:adenine-specific DNA-methyltransferase [Lachnospiraceae bacterium]